MKASIDPIMKYLVNGFFLGAGFLVALTVGLLVIDTFSAHQHYKGLETFFGVEGRPSDNIVQIPKGEKKALEKLKSDGYVLTQEGFIGAITEHYSSIINLLIFFVGIVTVLSAWQTRQVSITEARKMAREEAEEAILQSKFLEEMSKKLERSDVFQSIENIYSDFENIVNDLEIGEFIETTQTNKSRIDEILDRLDVLEDQFQDSSTGVNIGMPENPATDPPGIDGSSERTPPVTDGQDNGSH